MRLILVALVIVVSSGVAAQDQVARTVQPTQPQQGEIILVNADGERVVLRQGNYIPVGMRVVPTRRPVPEMGSLKADRVEIRQKEGETHLQGNVVFGGLGGIVITASNAVLKGRQIYFDGDVRLTGEFQVRTPVE